MAGDPTPRAVIYGSGLVSLGYITNVVSASGTEKRDAIGTGEFTMPAADTVGAALLEKMRIAVVVVDSPITGLEMGIAAFIIHSIKIVNSNGQDVIHVKGPSLLNELQYDLITGDSVNGDGLPYATLTDIIENHSTWLVDSHPSNMINEVSVYHVPNNETVLQGALRWAERTGQSFALKSTHPPERKVYFLSGYGQNSTGIETISTDPADDHRLISLEKETSFPDLFTRAYVTGGGLGDGSLTLKEMTPPAPSGIMTTTPATSTIVYDALEVTLGVSIMRHLQFSHIVPVDDSAAAITEAANNLHSAAVAKLTNNALERLAFKCEIVPSNRLIPGLRYELRYTNAVTGLTITGGWWLQDITYRFGPTGLTASATLTSAYYNGKDDQPLISILQNQQTALSYANTTAVGTAPSSGDDHGGLDALSLLDDDHPQYFLADGSRPMIGDIQMGAGRLVDGVDVSELSSDFATLSTDFTTHAANASAHHAPATGGDGISVTGQDVAVDATVVRTTRQINTGDGLSGGGDLSASRTIEVDASVVRTTRDLVAGDGLTGGGDLFMDRTFAVGAGDGISVTADAVAVDSSVVRTTRRIVAGDGLDGGGSLAVDREINVDSTVARTTTTLTAGNGLTGGGDLSASRTFDVGAGDGISVTADAVTVDGTVVRTTRTLTAGDGLTGGGDLSADRTFAINYGDGLTIAADVLQVSAGDGILLALGAVNVDSTVVRTDRQVIAGNGLVTGGALSSDVTLDVGTPTSVSATSVNSVTADSHVHAVIASANPGTAESLLKSTALGGLTLESLDLNGAFTGVGGSFSGALDVTQDFTVGANVLFVDVSQTNVGINCAPDSQFALDVNGNLRAQGWIVGKHALQIADATMICHFDGKLDDPANDFSGVSTGHMGQKATWFGAEIYRAGKFGKAVQVAPATTNLVTNPVFENGVSWSGNTGTGELSSDGYIGSNSLKITFPTGANPGSTTSYIQMRYHDVTVGLPYSAQCRYKVISDGGVDSLHAYVTGSAAWSGTYEPLNTDGEWHFYSASTPSQPVTGGAGIRVYIGGYTSASSDVVILLDAYQLEQSAFPTPFAYGDMPGHSWSGTAHASTSSRPHSHSRYEVQLSPTAGTISFWYKSPSLTNSDSREYPVVHYNSGNRIGFRFNIYGQLLAYFDDVSSALTGAYKIPDTWQMWTLAYDNGSYTYYLDGVPVYSGTSTNTPLSTASFFRLGYINSSDQYGNGWIDELLIVDRALDDDEVRAIYESNAPVFAETSTFSWSDPTTTIWVDGEGLYGRDTSGNAIIGLSTVDSKSWGGVTLNQGDLLIGRSGANSILWDNSAGSLTITGDGDGITNIDGGNIQTGTVTATQINVSQLSAISADMGSLTAGTITGATIRTAASGARVEMNSDGFDAYDERLMSFYLGDNKVGEFGTYTDGMRIIATENLSDNLITNWNFATDTTGWEDGGFFDYVTLTATTYDSRTACKIDWTESGPTTQAGMATSSYTDMTSYDGALLSLYSQDATYYGWTFRITWYTAANAVVSSDTFSFSADSGKWAITEVISEKPATATKCKIFVVSDSSQTPYDTETVYITNVILRGYAGGLGYLEVAPSYVEVPAAAKIGTYAQIGTYLQIPETGSNYASSTAGYGRVYIKGDKLIIAYKATTATRYKYLDLSTSSVTWVDTTTAP